MCSLLLKDLSYLLLLQLVLCRVAALKKSTRTSSIVQVIVSVWYVEISEDILRNQKLIIGQESFSNHSLKYLVPFR